MATPTAKMSIISKYKKRPIMGNCVATSSV